MTELSLNVSRVIKVPIESVYAAWLNPELLARFMLPGENMSVPNVEVDAREGGSFSITMKSPEQEFPHSGEYKTLNPYSQIVFTWESPFSTEGSTVTLNFNEVEKGTNIEIIHLKFPNEESRNNHKIGWDSILNYLEAVVK